jgi:tetratricopeptide (TPR) repeat protein
MKRRTLNLPIFALTVIGLAGSAAGFHYVRGWQLSKLSQTLLVHARADEKREKWIEAAGYLDRYLRLQPQNNAARAQLAITFARGATTIEEKQRAVALHYRALAADLPEHEEKLRVGLAELLLETSRLLEAENEAETLLKKTADHPQAKRIFALARFLQWQGGSLASERPSELGLLTDVEEALKKNPADIALTEIAAMLYREFPEIVAAHRSGLNQLSRERIADDLMVRMVEAHPDDAKAFLARHAYRAKYKLKDADRDIEKALSLAPENAKVLLVAGQTHLTAAALARQETNSSPEQVSRHLEQAKQIYQRLIDKDLAPESHKPHLFLGDVFVLEDSLDTAIATWKKGLTKNRQPTAQVELQARIADHLLKAGRIKESLSPMESIQSILGELGGTIRRQDHLALMQAQDLRRAVYFYYLGRFSESIGAVQQAIARQPRPQQDLKVSHRAWDLLGKGYAGLEDWTAAATAFDRAANFQPNTVESRLAAAQAWLHAGRPDLAIDRAEQVIAAEGLPQAWFVLATAEIQVQATTPPFERSWNGVRAALNALERVEPGSIPAPWRIDFLRADYIALRTPTVDDETHGQAAAAEVLRLAEIKHQERPEFWFDVCLAYERLGQVADAQRAWERLSGLPGAKTETVIAASRRATMHEDYTKANRILKEAAGAGGANERRLRDELLHVAQARQDLPEMKALLTEQLKERPNDVGILCRLAEIDLRAGDFAALKDWEQRLRGVGQLGDLWARYFRIVRLYSSAKDAKDPALQEALSQQAQLATLRPNWSES